MSSSNSHIPDHVLRWVTQNDKLQPRSNPDAHSQFVDAYANFQMPLHFDQYNPATWPEEYTKKQSEMGVHPYLQSQWQPPNPNQTYGDAHAPGWRHHGGREVSGRGKGLESSTSARRHHILVPQDVFLSQAKFILPPIEFTPNGHDEPGIDIGYKACATHTIENSTDKVFSQVQGMDEILIKILWPGYGTRYPFEARIGNVRNLSRRELLDLVCKAVVEFVLELKAKRAKVAKEHNKWMITVVRDGLKMERFFVARLHHRGGNYFQPEIWVPRLRGD